MLRPHLPMRLRSRRRRGGFACARPRLRTWRTALWSHKDRNRQTPIATAASACVSASISACAVASLSNSTVLCARPMICPRAQPPRHRHFVAAVRFLRLPQRFTHEIFVGQAVRSSLTCSHGPMGRPTHNQRRLTGHRPVATGKRACPEKFLRILGTAHARQHCNRIWSKNAFSSQHRVSAVKRGSRA